MDENVSDPNAYAHAREDRNADDWSPSDGQNARRYWLAVARRAIAEGKKRHEQRTRELEERRARRTETRT